MIFYLRLQISVIPVFYFEEWIQATWFYMEKYMHKLYKYITQCCQMLPFSRVPRAAEATSSRRHTKAIVVTLTLLRTVLSMSAFWTGLTTHCTLYIQTTKGAYIELLSCEKLEHRNSQVSSQRSRELPWSGISSEWMFALTWRWCSRWTSWTQQGRPSWTWTRWIYSFLCIVMFLLRVCVCVVRSLKQPSSAYLDTWLLTACTSTEFWGHAEWCIPSTLLDTSTFQSHGGTLLRFDTGISPHTAAHVYQEDTGLHNCEEKRTDTQRLVQKSCELSAAKSEVYKAVFRVKTLCGTFQCYSQCPCVSRRALAFPGNMVTGGSVLALTFLEASVAIGSCFTRGLAAPASVPRGADTGSGDGITQCLVLALAPLCAVGPPVVAVASWGGGKVKRLDSTFPVWPREIVTDTEVMSDGLMMMVVISEIWLDFWILYWKLFGILPVKY